MSWRVYIPHALAGGALLGSILALAAQPVRRLLARRRARRLAEAAHEQLPTAGSFRIPGTPPGRHRTWRIPKSKGRGYYHSA